MPRFWISTQLSWPTVRVIYLHSPAVCKFSKLKVKSTYFQDPELNSMGVSGQMQTSGRKVNYKLILDP
jgi:hypothetical protein